MCVFVCVCVCVCVCVSQLNFLKSAYAPSRLMLYTYLCVTHTRTHTHTKAHTCTHTAFQYAYINICIRDICILPVRILYMYAYSLRALPFSLGFLRFRISGPNLGFSFNPLNALNL